MLNGDELAELGDSMGLIGVIFFDYLGDRDEGDCPQLHVRMMIPDDYNSDVEC